MHSCKHSVSALPSAGARSCLRHLPLVCCRRRRALRLRRCCWVSISQPLGSSCSVLEVTPDRTTESADILWKTLSRKQRSKVRAVCMDMWQAYETSTETNAPNALIVHDRTWFSSHISNGLSAGINSGIHAIKFAAQDFSIFDYYRIRILFYCGKHSLKP